MKRKRRVDRARVIIVRAVQAAVKKGLGEYHVSVQVWNKLKANSSPLAPMQPKVRESKATYVRRAHAHYDARISQMVAYVTKEVAPMVTDAHVLYGQVSRILRKRRPRKRR